MASISRSEQAGEVGNGAVLDLLAFAVILAKEVASVGVAFFGCGARVDVHRGHFIRCEKQEIKIKIRRKAIY